MSGAREEYRIRRPGGPKKTGTAAAAALNEVKCLGAAVVPSLRSGRQEPLRAAATRENDKQEIQQHQNRHYDMQDSIDRFRIAYLMSNLLNHCAVAFLLIVIFVCPALAQGEAPEVHVVALVGTPFVVEKNGSLTGFSIDLWNAIAAQLNVKTSYQIMSNGNALEEAMRLKRADVIVSPVVITLTRFEQSDFSLPVLQAGLQIMVRDTGETAKPSGPLRDLLALLFSRTTLIWLGVALILVLIPAHLVWLLERRYKDGIISNTSYFPGIFEAVYWALSCLSTQAETMPRHWIARVLAVLWMFVDIVFVASYTAQLPRRSLCNRLKGPLMDPRIYPAKRLRRLRTALQWITCRCTPRRYKCSIGPTRCFKRYLTEK